MRDSKWGSPALSRAEQEDALSYDREQLLANAHELELIRRLRKILGSLLTEGRHSQYPEVVGEISLLRYVRGTGHNLEKAATVFQRHIAIREFYNLNDVRDKYYSTMLSRPNHSVSQEELSWGETVRAYLPMTLNAPLSERGDPFNTYWYISGRMAMLLETHGYERVMQYTMELSICRQIQLDLLSRRKQRLARLVLIFHAPHGGIWRLASSGPTREFFQRGNKLGYTMSSTLPSTLARSYIMNDSWGLHM